MLIQNNSNYGKRAAVLLHYALQGHFAIQEAPLTAKERKYIQHNISYIFNNNMCTIDDWLDGILWNAPKSIPSGLLYTAYYQNVNLVRYMFQIQTNNYGIFNVVMYFQPEKLDNFDDIWYNLGMDWSLLKQYRFSDLKECDVPRSKKLDVMFDTGNYFED